MRPSEIAASAIIPPAISPAPMRVCHTGSPVSRSHAWNTPLFCPAPTSARVRPSILMSKSCGAAAKSKSGPPGCAIVHTSRSVACDDHFVVPVRASTARIESESSVGSPV